MEILLGMVGSEAPTNRVWQSGRRSHQETSFEEGERLHQAGRKNGTPLSMLAGGPIAVQQIIGLVVPWMRDTKLALP
jgi:hypothetical protein